MVSPAVADAADRRRQAKLLAVLLAGSLLVAAAFAMLLPVLIGGTGTMAGIWATLGAAWLLALGIAATGEDRHARFVCLAVGTALLGFLVTVAGGLSSPAAIVLLALPFEAWWTMRSRVAAIAGTVAAILAAASTPLFADMMPAAAEPSGWHWVLPMAYAAIVGQRIRCLIAEKGEDTSEPAWGLEAAIPAVLMRLGAGGEVLDASARARAVLGVAPELLLGRGLVERIHVADRVGFLCALAEIRDGGEARVVEARLRLPRCGDRPQPDSHRDFAFELMSAPDGSTLALARPNEDLVAMRSQLAKALDAAEGNDIAKTRFLGAVSHELRTPLNAIIGFSDMLVHEMFGRFENPRQKEYVGLIRDSGHHLLSVVNAILDVSKIESGAYKIEPEPFVFADAVTMCRSMMDLQAAERGVRLEDRVSPAIGLVRADRRAVQQILINLLANAIKFTPRDGHVTIGASKVGSRLHFWVSDTGIGMAPADLQRIGEPFMQIDNDYTRRFEGTGLGLSLVKGLVSLHQGAMSIESAPGEGTVVSISFPVDGPAEDQSTGPADVAHLAQLKLETDDGALRKAG